MTSTIEIPAGRSHDLLWDQEKHRAEEVCKQGGTIFWQIDLGISEILENYTDLLLFEQRALALKTFTSTLYPLFAKETVGISLARSSLYREISPSYKEPLFAHLQAMTLFSSYLQQLGAFLPDEVPIYAKIDATKSKNKSDTAFLLTKERFRYIQLLVDGWFPSSGTLGCVIPKEELYSEKIAEQLNSLFESLKHTPFRLVCEELLHEEWQGIDTLIFLADGLSSSGRRKAQGFMATGGKILSYGGPLNIAGEEVLESLSYEKGIGAEGFEPPTYCSQSSRASQAALCSDFGRDPTPQ